MTVDKQALIDEFNDSGNLQIKLNDGGTIEIEQCIDYIVAERIGYNEAMKSMCFVEHYGSFFDIESLLETLEKEGILNFND